MATYGGNHAESKFQLGVCVLRVQYPFGFEGKPKGKSAFLMTCRLKLSRWTWSEYVQRGSLDFLSTHAIGPMVSIETATSEVPFN